MGFGRALSYRKHHCSRSPFEFNFACDKTSVLLDSSLNLKKLYIKTHYNGTCIFQK